KEDKQLKNIPFVFYSATYTEPKDQEFALNLGADRFILKPAEPDKFLTMLLKTEEDYQAGKLVSARQPIETAEYYKGYNAALVGKLENKMLQLEKVNRVLEDDIVERKRAEEALKASEIRYRRLFEAAKDGILILDAETGMILKVNPFLIKMLGYSREQFMGKTIWELGLLKDIIANKENFLELQQKEYIRYVDLPLETADGRRIDVEFVSNVYLVDNMKVIQCNIRDITEWLSQRKQAEAALRESEARYRILFEQAADIILQMEIMPEGMPLIRNVNSATLRLLGYERDELINQPVSFINVASDASQTISERRQYVLAGPGKVFESRHRCKDGSIRDFECSATELQIGSKTFAISVERDITERRKAEDELRNKTALLEAQLNSSLAGILIVDTNGKKILQNQRTVELWKIPQEIADNIDDATQVQHIMHSTKNPEQFVEKITYLYGHPNETTKDEVELTDGTVLERYSAPVLGKDGQDYGRIWTFHDITERKQHEKEKEKLLSQLLQAQKMEAIGTLAGGVAHDFNNLLCAISGYTTLAMGKINESDPVQRDLKQVSFAAEKAAGVVRQLLLFSRKQHMEPMPMDVNTTISRLLKMLERLIGEDIVIESNLENGIWNILGDEGNIEQLLMNLTVNARDAMPEGGKIFMKTENVTIDEEYCRTSKTARPGRFVRISVSDTGTGMDELTQQHIFEPFFTTKPAGKGTGLGLSVVFGIVQQHKGWINVYSEPGHGTTFSAYFPASSASPEQQSKENAGPASLEGKGERIMIVEDQAEVRAIAKELLLTNSYSVFAVSSAKEAMELFEKENGRFDLVFSDVVLPDRSGIMMVQELLKRWKFKVLITSGYTDEKAHWDFIKENNFRFLHKPYAVRDLLQAVREVLEKK
ncbi:MAG TPA: PAS domain S-box protein, partial [Chitinivibrionales bacterium]|nr:PAS domain S-box protein [Chitinivibrionales bacterium]